MNNKKLKILLIIPAYNEEKSILNTCKTICKYNKTHNTDYEYIVINDGSEDNTQIICEKNNIPHLNLCINSGIGHSVQTGYKYAKENNYDIAIQFDGDGQHDVSYIKDIIEPIINESADVVIGSRFIDSKSSEFKSSGARRAGINIISAFIKLFTGKKIYDTTSGFRATNKEIISLFAENYPGEYPEPVTNTTLLKKHYRIQEIPVSMNERKEGLSSIKTWKTIYFMISVVLLIIIEGLGGYKNE